MERNIPATCEKIQRPEGVWHSWGLAGRPVWLQWSAVDFGGSRATGDQKVVEGGTQQRLRLPVGLQSGAGVAALLLLGRRRASRGGQTQASYEATVGTRLAVATIGVSSGQILDMF